MTSKERILRALRRHMWGMGTAEMKRIMGIPEPSIRRCVAKLRKEGWNIETIESAFGEGMFYRLTEES